MKELLLPFIRREQPTTNTWSDVPTMSQDKWRKLLLANHQAGSVMYRSSGSTGDSVEIAYSPAVIEGCARRLVELLCYVPLSSELRVAVLYGYGCFPPADFYQRAFIQIGCDVLPLGSGRNLGTEVKCRWISESPVHGLIGTPSYLFRVGRVLHQIGSLGYLRLHLKFLISGGEPLFQRRRRELEELFGVVVFDHYGMLEAPMIAGSCGVGALHFSQEYLGEVETLTGIEETGEGQLVLSSVLAWPNCPMIRLLTGDHVILNKTPCGCGEIRPSLQVLGRVNNVRKIKGFKVSLSRLHRTLMDLSIIDYYIELSTTPDGLERVVLVVQGYITGEEVRLAISPIIPVEVEIQVQDEIALPLGPTGKPIRFIDNR